MFEHLLEMSIFLVKMYLLQAYKTSIIIHCISFFFFFIN